MARNREHGRYITNVLVSFVASYRARLEFFARKEAAMAEFYPEPFQHWLRGERHFNLVSKDTRRVIRFESNRLVVRAEGHSTMKPYDELIAITMKMFEEFGVRDLFAASLTLIRVHEQPTRKEARTKFARMFLSKLADDIMPMDGDSDYGVTFAREWTVSTEFIDMKPPLAPLRIKTGIAAGPTEYRELGERYCEFTAKADNEMYRTEHIAPAFGVMAATSVTLERHKAKDGVAAQLLWKFHEWARSEAESQWAKIERTLR